MEIHITALKHGISPDDIEHAVRNAIAADELDDDLLLYLGPALNGLLLEVITIDRSNLPELAIHAMPMRPKYERLLPGELP